MWSELPGHGFVLIKKKKINHGCGGNNCFVAITVTKIQNLLPFHNCSGMKLPQMVFSFYMEVMSKEQAWCVTAHTHHGRCHRGGLHTLFFDYSGLALL